MSKSNVLTLRLPLDLKQRVERLSQIQGISMNQLAMYMISNEVSQLEMQNRISHYYRDKKEEDILSAFDKVMKKSTSTEPVPEWDQLPK